MKEQEKPLLGSVGGNHFLAGLISHHESYGAHVIESFVRRLKDPRTVVDLGAGVGRDLGTVRKIHPQAKLIAIEAGREFAGELAGKADIIEVANIEHDRFPLEDGEADLIIANQILEHTKEVFWIFNEISRTLKVGGHLIFGVPNICSFHNRLLLPLGKQPTQHKVCSAHVRPFSKADTLKFLQSCFPDGYKLIAFKGAQFYPFPGPIARVLANLFPTFAFSIFFMVQKVKEYEGEFALYPGRAQLQTNFWTGEDTKNSQY